MKLDISVLASLMIHLILRQVNSALTITKDGKPPYVEISPSKPLSQMASLTPSVTAMYLPSVVDKAIVDCNVAFQLIAHPPKLR